MPPGRRLLAGVVAGLAVLVLLSIRHFRHPATRRLTYRHPERHAGYRNAPGSDACEYCGNLTRDWETRVCRILSGGAGDGSGFADFFFSGIAANATRARAQGEEVSLTGGAGDGYCFDTNSIHAGELSGRKARYVVVMEFHSGVIEDAFSRHGLRFRSPFGLR